jgi:uncharacterized protein with ParB-like and HNH nuclease domain
MKSEKEIEDQIREKQQTVDYDIKEYPVEIIVKKYVDNASTDENEIFIPAYQRSFVWEDERQSKFIESLLLKSGWEIGSGRWIATYSHITKLPQ